MRKYNNKKTTKLLIKTTKNLYINKQPYIQKKWSRFIHFGVTKYYPLQSSFYTPASFCYKEWKNMKYVLKIYRQYVFIYLFTKIKTKKKRTHNYGIGNGLKYDPYTILYNVLHKNEGSRVQEKK